MMLAILSIIGGFIRQSSRVQTVTEFGERHRVHMRSTLDRMGNEVQDAWQVVNPTTGTDTELRFTRVNGLSDPARLPPVPVFPAPMPTTFDLLPSSAMLSVRYYVVGGELRREASQPGHPTVNAAMFGPTSGFSATKLPGRVMEITLSTQKDLKIESAGVRVYCPCL